MDDVGKAHWEVILLESSRGERFVEEFILTQQESTQAKIAHEIDLLEQHGPLLTIDNITYRLYNDLTMRTWREVKKDLLKNQRVAAEYARLHPRYKLISQLIEARRKRGFTQEDLARKIGTKQSAIARVESGSANPTIEFLEKLASALGSRLIVQVR